MCVLSAAGVACLGCPHGFLRLVRCIRALWLVCARLARSGGQMAAQLLGMRGEGIVVHC